MQFCVAALGCKQASSTYGSQPQLSKGLQSVVAFAVHNSKTLASIEPHLAQEVNGVLVYVVRRVPAK